jgi:hypothetical protein
MTRGRHRGQHSRGQPEGEAVDAVPALPRGGGHEEGAAAQGRGARHRQRGSGRVEVREGPQEPEGAHGLGWEGPLAREAAIQVPVTGRTHGWKRGPTREAHLPRCGIGRRLRTDVAQVELQAHPH